MKSHEAYQRPSREEIARLTQTTREALQRLIDVKTGNTPAAEPTSTYVKYTSNGGLAARPTERVLKIQDIQEDPMLPPKHQLRKNRHRDTSPPAPVLREAVKPATAEEHKAWLIPSAVSHWKNPLGFTVSINQRLAANNGGTLEKAQTELNEASFVNLAEALSDADRRAREDIRIRAEAQKERAALERKVQEERLRTLAARARQEKRSRPADAMGDEQTQRREQLRAERREQAVRGLRGPQREVSERVVLGAARATAGPSALELVFDQRLFTKAAGTGAGIGEDQMYDAPLFVQGATGVYRPKTVGGQDLDLTETRFDDLDIKKTTPPANPLR